MQDTEELANLSVKYYYIDKNANALNRINIYVASFFACSNEHGKKRCLDFSRG